MFVAAVEGSKGMVTVYVDEEEVRELFDLVLSKHHLGRGALAAAKADFRIRRD